MLFLRHTSPMGKERQFDSFLAGLLGGYTVFGRTIHNSVSQQIVIYVAARVCLALAKLAVQPRQVGGAAGGHKSHGHGGSGWELFGNGEMRRALVRNGWPAFASLSWAMVMYIFRWHPESVQSSLRSSMSYMWVFFLLLLLLLFCWVSSPFFFGYMGPFCLLLRSGLTLREKLVMCNPTSGIPYGRCCGIINEKVGMGKGEKCSSAARKSSRGNKCCHKTKQKSYKQCLIAGWDIHEDLEAGEISFSFFSLLFFLFVRIRN
jgi:hypothetical protein